jgi:glycerol-3-phosphate O-acyltransferase / dihydroxyacetone phosphate acyltransferase
LVFRDKERFRSEARVVIGPPVAWSDLAGAGEGDAAAVRALTARIEDALRDVTLNLESWEDAPLVEAADAIWAAEFGGSGRDADRLLRLRAGVARLAALRREGDAHWQRVAREVLRHARLLDRLGLTPATLRGDAALRAAAGWTLRRLPLAAAAPLAWLGAALFWPPWRLTGVIAEAMKPDANVRSTNRLLVGIVVYTLWLLLLVALAGVAAGGRAAAVSVLLLPLFGVGTLWLREALRDSRRDARRFLLMRSRRRLIAELRTRQQRLAAEIARAVPTDPSPAR